MRFSSIIAASVLALAGTTPTVVQAQNVQQLLQGLTTGNQSQDQALRDAFERGYQKGRQDEAQLQRRSGGNRNDDRRNSDEGRSDSYDQGNRPYRR